MREKDLYLPVKNFLEDTVGCNKVYGEVLNSDVLGIKGTANIVVELKTRLSFHLLDQALERLRLAQYVYIAVPSRRSPLPKVVSKILKQEGIGLLYVYNNKHSQRVSIRIPARFNRDVSRYINIRKHIKDYHEDEVGGVPSGEGKTEYSITIDSVKSFLRRKDWVTIDEILEHCETHYAQPKPSLSRTLVEDWNQDWCEVKVVNRTRYFRYKR